MRRTVQEEGTGCSDGRQTKPSGWEARSLSRVHKHHQPHLIILLSDSLLFHQVANIEVKLVWQDNRLATTEILVRKSVFYQMQSMTSNTF